MSQADIETLRAGYEALSRGDRETVFREFHPDIEFKTFGGRAGLLGETYRGSDQVRRFIDDLWAAFEEVVIQPEDFFQRDDRILVFVRTRSRPTGSSAVVESRTGHLWTMRDGKAARLELFPQRENALEALGLSEQDAHADS